MPNNDTSRSHDSLVAELHALLEVTRNLRKNLTAQEVLLEILDAIFPIFPVADRGFLALRNDKGEIVPRWGKSLSEAADRQFRNRGTAVNYVINRQGAALSGIAPDNPRFRSGSINVAAMQIDGTCLAYLGWVYITLWWTPL